MVKCVIQNQITLKTFINNRFSRHVLFSAKKKTKNSGRKQKEKPHTVISHFIHYHIQLCVFFNFHRSSHFQKNDLRHIASVFLCYLRHYRAFFLKPTQILFWVGVNKRNMWSNIFYISGIDTQRPLPPPSHPSVQNPKPTWCIQGTMTHLTF